MVGLIRLLEGIWLDFGVFSKGIEIGTEDPRLSDFCINFQKYRVYNRYFLVLKFQYENFVKKK